jgi:hypothetical protein
MAMSYRNDLEALAARHDALAAEVATKTRELDGVSHLLDEAKQRAKLPILPNIRVASPCSADWNAMTGDDRVRACGDCNKNVYNISELTREEAEALIVAKEGRLCVRYFQRKDGTILLKDCEVAVSQKRKRRIIAAGAAALLAGGAGAGFMLTRPNPAQRAQPALGEVAVEPVELPIEVEGKLSIESDLPAPEPEPPTEEAHHTQGLLEVKMGDYAGPMKEGDTVEHDGTVLVAPK